MRLSRTLNGFGRAGRPGGRHLGSADTTTPSTIGPKLVTYLGYNNVSEIHHFSELMSVFALKLMLLGVTTFLEKMRRFHNDDM